MSDQLTNRNSLDERSHTAMNSEGRDEEFRPGVTEDFDPAGMSEMSRKQFLALLAASAAFAATGCSDYRDKGAILPYVKKPEGTTPGVANYYASTCMGCLQACGILLKTREGRPIKVDGNPDHPINRGKICAKGQASILNLYDPYRLRSPQFGSLSGKSGSLDWKKAESEISARLADAGKQGKEIALVTRSGNSPSSQRVLNEFVKKFPTARVCSYDSLQDESRVQAWQKCYGAKTLPVVDWSKAKIILALESDFLGTDGFVMEQIRGFTNARDVNKSVEFNRLYSLEGSMTLTGANADYRMRLRPDMMLEFVASIIRELGGEGIAQAAPLKEFAKNHELSWDVLEILLADLRRNRGRAIVYAGNVLPESVHVAVNYLNDLIGGTELYRKDAQTIPASLSSGKEMDELVQRMKSGSVGVLIHFDSNPAYDLPAIFEYESSIKSVPTTVAFTETENETSRLCAYVLPINHAFESWGDYKVRTGILSLQQPVIAPLYDTRQKEAVLLTWIQGSEYKETAYHEFLKSRWEKEVYPSLKLKVDFKTFWYSALHDGVIEFKERTEDTGKFNRSALNEIAIARPSSFAVVLQESFYLGDGRNANNGWLQELPHPISKVVWDNYAAVSAQTAKSIGVENNDLVEIKTQSGAVKIPVLLQSGQADNTISLTLGYGRTSAGPVGNGVGVNVRTLLGKERARILAGVTLSKVVGKHQLVTTQEQHSLDDEFLKDLHLKRKIIREGTVGEFNKHPKFLHEDKPELFSIAKEVEYHGVKWAMSVDLNKCIGCNACVAGCNVENNIPVVGKEQAANGRVMHWIRLDRYYSGTETDPSFSFQPMLCQHCDSAPCENVCPVVATNHSPDGLNQMVYNRCVGTKYCSNNCPYKVRRFNFFNWRDSFAEGYYELPVLNLVHNPEVTVRSRGVMEKCTFCVQRIMEARQHATEQGRELHGSDVKTACQEACPATAIVFGDMNDTKSDISHFRNHDLGYHVLEELNVRPNVTYVAKLRNKV